MKATKIGLCRYGADGKVQKTPVGDPPPAEEKLFINGEKVAEGWIPAPEAGIFSADETADVGIDLGTPVGGGNWC